MRTAAATRGGQLVAAPLTLPPALPPPYDAPPSQSARRPLRATRELVEAQVRALTTACPTFAGLSPADRRLIEGGMVRIATYAAELVRDAWYQTERHLDQRPVVRVRNTRRGTLARPLETAGEQLVTGAANQIGRVTEETLNAIAFPTFVADLIRGSFNAIVDASIQQMEAYGRLLADVSKTVEQFMDDNITDNMARDWLVQAYPAYLQVREGLLTPRDGSDEQPPPRWRERFSLNDDVAPDDGDTIEEVLVPAARRALAQNRLQLLSTMVLMGVNRIVVTSGKIRATMGFHIDTTDRVHEEQATDLDFRTALQGSANFGAWSASASMSFSYVRSTRRDSDSELNVDADLTGEVEIQFKSDYFPLNRFMGASGIEAIRQNTGNPEGNTSDAQSLSSGPLGDSNYAYRSPRSRRSERRTPTLRPIGDPLPEVRRPVEPDPVAQRPAAQPDQGGSSGEQPGAESAPDSAEEGPA